MRRLISAAGRPAAHQRPHFHVRSRTAVGGGGGASRTGKNSLPQREERAMGIRFDFYANYVNIYAECVNQALLMSFSPRAAGAFWRRESASRGGGGISATF